MPAKFEVYTDKRGEWRWRLRSANNVDNIASSGEGYKSKASCLNGVEAVKRSAPEAEIVYPDQDKK
ncbi:MAG: DUF1508 domain-containing protein [Gemmatimonadetes bacterium]|nr:DUF1508 domain-containing protein [Gemmatimonadota bacterium]